MEKITTLRDLLIEQLRELYNAEKHQKEALIDFERKCTFKELKNIIHSHLDETDEHIDRLEDIFEQLEVASFGERSAGMLGLVQEGYDLVNRSADPEVLDASIIAAIQYLEHFEIAGYGTASTFARELGLKKVAELLELTLDEEKDVDEKLSDIAIEQINVKAISPVIS